MLVDDNTPNAEMSQSQSHRQPDRPSTHDQYITAVSIDHSANVPRPETR
jgi:hypothetical protein